MKRVVGFFATVVLLLFTYNGQAESRFGVGFVLGSPTALSFNWYTSEENAFDLQVAFFSDDYFLTYADHTFHFPEMMGSGKYLQLSPYFGLGAFGVFATKDDHPRGNYFDKRTDDYAIGARIPFGLEWLWKRAPLGIGLEVAPGIVVAPSTIGALQAGLTLRYYF